MDTVCMVLSFDILRNKVHGAWAVQRNSCNDVLQILAFQLLHETGHPCTFQLEHSICLSSSQHLIYILIIIINMIDIQGNSLISLSQFYCILDDCQGSEAQEIHFQK